MWSPGVTRTIARACLRKCICIAPFVPGDEQTTAAEAGARARSVASELRGSPGM